MALYSVPVLILKEGTQRTVGKDALRANIMAARALAEVLKTSLGPRGLDKMLVDSFGDVTVTNDGATILEELDVAHPAAKLLVQAAKAQDNTAGDGTTSVTVLAAALLDRAEKLLEEGVHPIIIVTAYKKALEKARDYLEKKLAKKVDIEKDVELLKRVAVSSLNSKLPHDIREFFAELAYKAAKIAYDPERNYLDLDLISIIQKEGRSLTDSELIEGVVVDKSVVHPEMPKLVKDAKIALINQNIEIEKADVASNVTLRGLEALELLKQKEKEKIEELVKKLVDLKVNVVFCQRGISDLAQDIMAKYGILAARRVRRIDMLLLSRATGGKIVSNMEDLIPDELGYASVVEESKVGDENMTFVRGCKNAKSVTILVRGSTEHVADEAERAIVDSIGDLMAALKVGKVVAGAGSPEVELSKYLGKYAESLSGREQLAVKAFAEAMEVIPRTLAENAGLDPIDTLTELKLAHEKNQITAGIDVFTGKVMDAWKKGVIEPLKIKTQAVSSATEVATMIS